MATPRSLIVELLCRTEQGEHSNQLLTEALSKSAFDERERRFIAALFYGTLRWQVRIDHELEEVLDRRLQSLHPKVRNILRLGLYQIDYAYSVPVQVAVDTSVDLAKELGVAQAKALINAVLRKLSRVRKRLLKKHESLNYALTSEIFGLLKQAYGPEIAVELAKVFLQERDEIALRPNLLRTDLGELRSTLEKEGVLVEAGKYLPEALRIKIGGRDIASLDSFSSGLWTVQDEAAQLLGALAEPKAGDRILDACAAPGGKSGDLYARSRGRAFILAGELKADRLSSLNDLFERLGYDKAESIDSKSGIYPSLRDATAKLSESELELYDCVILDVPCSATGLLGKQVDLRTKLTYQRVQELLAIQSKILQQQAAGVKKSGHLIYSTCSILPAENTEQIASFLATDLGKKFERVEISPLIPESLKDKAILDSQGEVLLRPDLTPEIDGFFIAKLRRKDE